jgi:hypothetical protein
MLENGEASINKMDRVISIATPENEAELAEKIKVLPKSALATLVRDIKADGLNKPQIQAKLMPGHASKNTIRQTQLAGQTLAQLQTYTSLNFEIDEDVAKEFNELNSKGIDVNELLRKMLKNRREEIADEKEWLAYKYEDTRLSDFTQENTGKPMVSRYIPVEIKEILHDEYGDKCSINTCLKPSTQIHHTQRYSLSQNHDPNYLAPLCKDHHVIAHSIDVKYHDARANLA